VSLAISRPKSVASVALRAAIVGLTLATGYIHLTLGGLLFFMNAAGYATLAAAMVAPIALAADYRWLVRLGLMGYAATTITAWAIMGPYFTLAYIAKGVEVTLIVLLAVEMYREVGGPVAVGRRIGSLLSSIGSRLVGRRSQPAGI
jgi:hypothetical protein